MARRPGKTLEKWEVAIVKVMLQKNYVPQDIQAYFSRPTRSVNQARISQIKDGKMHVAVKPASDVELDAFLNAWLDMGRGEAGDGGSSNGTPVNQALDSVLGLALQMPAMQALGKELGVSLENGMAGVANDILDVPTVEKDAADTPKKETAKS